MSPSGDFPLGGVITSMPRWLTYAMHMMQIPEYCCSHETQSLNILGMFFLLLDGNYL